MNHPSTIVGPLRNMLLCPLEEFDLQGWEAQD